MKHPGQNNTIDIAIIGGGAAGMAAAWFARRTLRDIQGPPPDIAVFERNNRLGKKLLSTGNGRCNLTNLAAGIDRYHGEDPEFTRPALAQFPPLKVISLFEEIGVVCCEEEERKVFPASLHASSVLDALRCALDEHDISTFPKTKITAVARRNNRFALTTSSGETFLSATVIFATGGTCAPTTGSDGNGYRLIAPFADRCIPPLPSIVQLTTETSFVKPLAGHKIRGTVTLFIDNKRIAGEQGEILFTDYGLSGPPVLQLSGYVARAHGASDQITAVIDFLPTYSPDEVVALFQKRKHSFSGRTLEEYCTGLFQRRLAYGLMKTALGKPLSTSVATLSDNEIDALAGACKHLPITVTGTRSLAHAQVTAGGIATSDFNPATMESLRHPGLFACGELLDIDGDCGGFNLQWAWASGFCAGGSAADYLQRNG